MIEMTMNRECFRSVGTRAERLGISGFAHNSAFGVGGGRGCGGSLIGSLGENLEGGCEWRLRFMC